MTNTDRQPELDRRVEELAQRTVELCANRTGDQRSLEALNRLKTRWRTRTVPCVVAGEVSGGKSTLVNAIVGAELLPTDSRAWTSTWARIHHASNRSATALLLVDGERRRVPVAVDELAVYLSVDGARTLRRRHGPNARVLSVDVGLPHPLLETGLELLDTPGVNGLHNAHLLAAHAGLVRADALVFVARPDEPISASERIFLAEASARISTCVLVHTHRDRHPEPDQALRDDLASLTDEAQWTALLGDAEQAREVAARLATVTGVSVSSSNRLTAATLPDGPRRDTLLAESHLPVLTDILTQDIAGNAARAHRRNIVRLCSLLVRDTLARVDEHRAVLLDDAAAEARLAGREADLARWTANNGDFWRKDFDRAGEVLATELAERAAARSTALNREYRSALTTMRKADLKRAVDTLAEVPGLLLVDLLDHGSTGLNAAVERVRELLAVDELDGPLDRMMTADLVEQRAPAAPALTETADPGAAEVRAALLGGMTGAGAAGLAVPALVKAGFLTAMAVAPVLVPAILGAALFGGLQWGQHNRQRAATDAVVYLDEVRACLTGPTVTEATTLLRSVAAALATQIEESLRAQQADIATTRTILADAATRTDPQARQARLAELDQTRITAHTLHTEATAIDATC